ncbi:RDD family protein [Neobacillus notoginsengisoli]|uniref:RDD family protein n=1 Tax=Neobacillus notoginsengisoli TaxID=1578198 RepID=A0A417YUA1_9BACI|nr:RDD family protein [Neobacillus notoginsengisoli]RHW40753.1 RDD family protein [Neobacillus notoginsengisoli]
MEHYEKLDEQRLILEENSSLDGEAGTPLRFAGFWMRFWAYLLDLIVAGSIFRLIAKPVFRFFEIESSGGLFSPDTIVSAVIFYLYFVLMTKFFHQTLGKMVFGLAVIDIKDGNLSWIDVLIREWIGRFISSWIIILYIIPAFHPKKQALHDIFADTAVIHTER